MKELVQALCRAKKKFEPFRKNGTIKGKNGVWHYAMLEDINAAIQEALADEGIHHYHTYDYEYVFEMPMLVTTCWLTDGEYTLPPTSVKLPMGSVFDALNPPQATGSLLSYGRRYSLVAAAGLAADIDDDAQSGGEKEVAPESRQILAPASVPRIVPRTEPEAPRFETDDPILKGKLEWCKRKFDACGVRSEDRPAIIAAAKEGKDMPELAMMIAACTGEGQRA